MPTIGEATVAIVADSAAFDRTLATLGKSTANALERGTQGFVDRADDLGERFGSRLGESASRWLRRGLVAGAAGAAAAIGVTLVKGFKRFTTIEDATATLTLQLGSATKAAGLLNKVLKVVEGTPFGLDQFVGAARNLVAASIPLEKVPRILQAIADGAAAAGGNAQDVDNVVNALGRLATGAELTLGPIRDLEEQGVPALRILANRAGVSTTKMAKDITKGTVASGKAIDDLVEGIINGTEGINGATVAFGGAAQNVGNTVSGAFSNMQVAIARAGAKIIKVFADGGAGGNAIVVILNRVRQTIDILGDAAVRLAKKFVGSDGFGSILDFFEKLPGKIETAVSFLGTEGGLKRAFESLFGTVDLGGLLDRLVDGLLAGFDKLPHEKISRLFTNFIVSGISAIAENIAEIVAAVVKAAPAIIKGIAEGLLTAARENPLDTATLIIALGVPGVAPALAAFFGAMPFGSIVAPLISGLGKAIRTGLGTLFGSELLAPFVLKFKTAFAAVFSGPGLLTALGAAFGILTSFLVSKIGGTLETILKALLTVNPVTRLMGLLSIAFDEGFSNLGKIVLRFFTQTLPQALGRVIEGGFRPVFSFFASVPGRIVGAFGNVVARMAGLGRNIVNGLVNGIRSAAGRVRDALLALVPSPLRGALGFLFGLSPSPMFTQFGRNFVDGLVLGIKKAAPQLDKTLLGLTGDLATAGPSLNLGKFSPTTAPATPAFAPRAPIEQTFIIQGKPDERVLANELAFRMGRDSQR